MFVTRNLLLKIAFEEDVGKDANGLPQRELPIPLPDTSPAEIAHTTPKGTQLCLQPREGCGTTASAQTRGKTLPAHPATPQRGLSPTK